MRRPRGGGVLDILFAHGGRDAEAPAVLLDTAEPLPHAPVFIGARRRGSLRASHRAVRDGATRARASPADDGVVAVIVC